MLYAVAGVMGGVVALMFQFPLVYLVGGSGALFGMMGAIVAINLRGSRNLMEGFRSHGTRIVFILLAVNLAIGLLIPGISNTAHGGGLISGFVVTFCFLYRGRNKPDTPSRVIQAAWIAVFLSLVFYAVFPVLRWDYQYRAILTAETTEDRGRFEEVLDMQDGLRAFFREGNGLPFTGSMLLVMPKLEAESEMLKDAADRWRD